MGIVKLHQGTVVFEDVEPHRLRGRVTRPLTRLSLRKQSDPLPGRLVTYQLGNSHEALELPYGDKDQRGEFTLQVTLLFFLPFMRYLACLCACALSRG